MIGKTVSHYRIEEKLGEGGMGVVYRAEDTRLGRSVALKALTPEYARDPGRRQRFQQEARAAARLTHPGIAAVYELEEVCEDLYIVYEYVRGQNLRGLVTRGDLKLDTVLDIATDIAAALAAAHAQGIVHRDIKPENIMRTPEGETKILDFGLARFQPGSLDSATRSGGLTDVGSIVGTVAYMSPEQLEGREADFRTDIFSFGVLLYELATGVRPFEGTSPASTIARVLTSEPVPMMQRNPVTPPELDRIVRKCLRKRAEERYQSTRDLLVDLENLRRDTTGGAPRAEAAGEEAGLLESALASFTLSPRRWWEANQIIYVIFNAVMIYIGWQVKEWVGGSRGLALFLGVVVCAAASTSLRVILLGTATVTPRNLPAELHRVGPWARVVDLTFTGMLFVLAGSIVSAHPGWAALLVGFGVAGLVAFLIIDPTLVRAAFPELRQPEERTASGRRPLRWPLALGLVVLPAVGVLATILTLNVGGLRERLAGSFGTGAPRIESLAVLPLENLSRDPEQEYFADGMTEALIADLAQISALRVISRTSVMQYKGVRKPLPEIARELYVDAVVEGSVQRAGDRVRITAQLIHAPTDKHLWAQSYERDLRDVLALQSEVARTIAAGIKVKLTAQEEDALAASAAVRPEAYEAYLQGKFYFRRHEREKGRIDTAIQMFDRATTLDPQFALAHAALADAYVTKFFSQDPNPAWEEKAYLAIEKALALQPNLAEAYVARGDLAWTLRNRFPHERAIADYRRALELNPNLTDAHFALGSLYLHVGLLDESLEELNRALALDPHNLDARYRVPRIHLYQQNYQAVLAEFERHPEFPPLWQWQKALALSYLGRKQAALALAEELVRQHPDQEDITSTYALVLAGLGQHYKAEQEIRTAVRGGEGKSHFHHAAYNIASAYALMGRKGQAVQWLRRTAAEGMPCYPLFAKDPNLDKLRGDAEFETFLKEMKAQWAERRARLFPSAPAPKS
jgi:TolB-like protein/Tfp pilus assembly protein PilF/predicted Ser/Thr protein kinase